MSGSGGFYKYRCKYFLTHNCPHWVYVNGAPCAYCCAEGREADENETETRSHPAAHVPRMTTREICVPRVSEGTLQYTLMEFVESGQGNYWAVRYKMPPPQLHHHLQQQQQQQQQHQPMIMSTSMVTSDTPRSVMGVAGPGQHAYHHQMGQMMAVGY
ncbi:hypothetical protein B0T18DRAFT_214461 [Schizothecium vesticola]|uniref:Uncharacterized protein n=1 Tax=Schizothecium vesticola TaxID=314040 RepID=A0AA40JZD5_9PEZI|nr:hypothetical protein B0T18DRAFT_214461 [Schizothecium vesticola]